MTQVYLYVPVLSPRVMALFNKAIFDTALLLTFDPQRSDFSHLPTCGDNDTISPSLHLKKTNQIPVHVAIVILISDPI